MTTRDRFDIDGLEDIEPENAPHPEFTDPQGSGLGAFWLVASVLVIAACFMAAFWGGW